jgi:hypothetical protein
MRSHPERAIRYVSRPNIKLHTHSPFLITNLQSTTRSKQ